MELETIITKKLTVEEFISFLETFDKKRLVSVGLIEENFDCTGVNWFDLDIPKGETEK